MKIVLVMLKKTLFWSYERGTWQYDFLCVLILAFIFFTPNDLFRRNDAVVQDTPAAAQADRTDSHPPDSTSQAHLDTAANKKPVEPIKATARHNKHQESR